LIVVGARQGFPLDVTEELLVLRDYYQGRYPNGVSASAGVVA